MSDALRTSDWQSDDGSVHTHADSSTAHSAMPSEPSGSSDALRSLAATTIQRDATPAEKALAIRSDPLLRWLLLESGTSPLTAVNRLCECASVIVCDFGDLISFATGRDALAYALLDEYARARGLRTAELIALLVEPAASARAAIQTLMLHYDDAVIAVARLNRSLDVRRRGEGNAARRRDRGQVRRR